MTEQKVSYIQSKGNRRTLSEERGGLLGCRQGQRKLNEPRQDIRGSFFESPATLPRRMSFTLTFLTLRMMSTL